MPLGTGNDLSRALGWGPGISTTKDVKYFLKYLETKPLPTLMDRWLVKVTSQKTGKVIHDFKMLLYCGIGLDAKFSYQFNLIRKKFPYFFKTRAGNKFFYSQVGAFNLVAEKKQEMQKILKIQQANQTGELSVIEPHQVSENIVFQNTSFWGGGCFDMWGCYDTSAEDDKISVTSQDSTRNHRHLDEKHRKERNSDHFKQVKPQTHSDKLLECMSFRSLFHMGQIQVGLAKADRLSQASGYRLEVTDKQTNSLYLHVDGEGYLLTEPVNIEVSHHDQITMNINKVKTQTSKYLADILQVLNTSVEDRTISKEQKLMLYEKFVKSL